MDEPASVYPEIMPPRAEEAMNAGGVNFGLNVELADPTTFFAVSIKAPTATILKHRCSSTRTPNLIWVNFRIRSSGYSSMSLNSDPKARFEEVRPYFGAEWTLKPIIIAAGFTSYIHP